MINLSELVVFWAVVAMVIGGFCYVQDGRFSARDFMLTVFWPYWGFRAIFREVRARKEAAASTE